MANLSEPSPASLVLVTTNGLTTTIASENREVSPVAGFVDSDGVDVTLAIAVIVEPAGRALVVKTRGTVPLAGSALTAWLPSRARPWSPGKLFSKYWTR